MRRQWPYYRALIAALFLSASAYAQLAPDSFPGCVYNATPPTLANRQVVPWQCDVNGKLITTGGGGGSGTVNAGLLNQLGYYAAAGTTISGSANIGTSTTGQLVVIPATPHLSANGAAILVNGNTAAEVVFTHPVAVHIQGADGENDGFDVSAYGANTVGAFIARHALGTAASPSADTLDTQLLKLAARGYRATTYSNNIGGLGVFAAGTFTDTSTPTYVSLLTNATATTNTEVEVLRGQPGGGVSIGDAAWNATDRATGVLAIKTSAVIGAGPVLTATNVPTLDAATNAFTGTLLSVSGGATLPTPTASASIQLAHGTTSGATLELDSFNANGFVVQRRAQTSSTSPGAIVSGNQLGSNLFQGWNATSYVTGASVRANSTTTTWDGTHNGASLTFQTTADASATATDQLRIQGSGGISVGNANIATDGGAGVVVATSFTGAGTGLTGTAASLTAGTVTTNANLTGPIASSGNTTSITAQTGTGTTFVMQASPTLTTPVLGVATATSINGNIFTTGTYTLTGQAGKTLTFNGSITLTGTDAQTYTFPTTSATIARTDAGQTFTGTNTFSNTLIASGNVSGGGNITAGNGSQFTWQGTNGIITSPSAAGTIQHGAADAASPVAQKIIMQSVVAGNANTAGANATLQGSLSNGSGGGDILVKTTLSVAASGTQNTAATAITFKGGDQSIIMASTTDATSTSTGALQIAGGVSITKRVFTAGLTASAGLQTAVLCLSSSNEIIADSVACLASSERFKQDIAPFDLGLAAVMVMQPIVYRYAPTGNERFDNAPNQRDIHAGFRAEDIAKIDRRLVALDADGAVRTVRQDGITASLVKAVQEQQAKIDAIERRLR